ncbi:MAG: hypothetical protein COA78_04055 [Blastopirellula sp.]|nr:MAG: hypothetical protein COA78_04055 [Blastopirellula sp.]
MSEEQILLGFKQGKSTAEDVYEYFVGRKKILSPIYPLSEGQKGIWMSQELAPDASIFNVPICFRLRQKLDVEIFCQAIKNSLEIHPVLKRIIRDADGIPYQTAKISGKMEFDVEDLLGESEDKLKSRISAQASESFDLACGPLIRTRVFRLAPQEYVVLIVVHHIVFDGASIPKYLNSLFECYESIVSTGYAAKVDPVLNFDKFVDWEGCFLESEEGDEAKEYWRRVLADLPKNLNLSIEKQVDRKVRNRSQICKIRLAPDVTMAVKSLCKSKEVSPAIIFLALYKVMLARYSNSEDIVVGMPTMGRPLLDHENLVGYFVNMLPIRSNVKAMDKLDTFLESLEMKLVNGIDNSNYPFSCMVRDCSEAFDPAVHPIFQVAYVFQNRSLMNLDSIGIRSPIAQGIEFLDDVRQGSEFKLQLEIFEELDSYSIELKYASASFDNADMVNFLSQLKTLVSSVCDGSNKQLSDYELLSGGERERILNDWNMPSMPLAENVCLNSIFEEQVERHGSSNAIETDKKNITYNELNEKANNVSKHLLSAGVTKGDLVAVCADHSAEFIVLILGIIKIGAGYVPIDLRYPESRIQFILDDSNARVLLTNFREISSLNLDIEKIVNIHEISIPYGNTINHIGERISIERPGRCTASSDAAYVCYTSGSEGNPKGVLVEHKSIVRLVCCTNYVSLNSQTKTLLHSPASFDATTFELWAPLLNGGCIAVNDGEITDPQELSEALDRFRVNTLWLTSGLFSLYSEQIGDLPTVKNLLVGGDVVSPKAVKTIYEKNREISIVNLYGPTENTTFSTYFRIPREFDFDKSLPIGVPVSQTTAYIVDEELNLQPAGVMGELCLGGLGVAREYLNNIELSRCKFVKDPYSDEQGSMLYKSGDYARWLPDGNIEFMGRQDDQVKIRGFRIELTELENTLSKHDLVEHCAAQVKSDSTGDKYLVAYVVLNSSSKSLAEVRMELGDYLSTSVPSYLVPSSINVLEEIPLTLNGKIDRRLLDKSKDISLLVDEHIPLFSDTQQSLASIWSEILNCELKAIGATANFFEVGGHSLSLTRVVSKVNDRYLLDLTLKDVVEHPVLGKFAEFIDKKIGEKELDEIPKVFEKLQSIKGMTDESLDKILAQEALLK